MSHASQERQRKASGTHALMVWWSWTSHWYAYYWMFSGMKCSVWYLYQGMLQSCIYIHVEVHLYELSRLEGDLCSLLLYMVSLRVDRCLRMTGAVSLRWGRMTRSPADGCAAAATSRPWQKKTAATRTAVPNPRPRSRHDEPATWRPRSRPSQRWPHSSKCVCVCVCQGLDCNYISIILWIVFFFNQMSENEGKKKLSPPHRNDQHF